MMGCNVISPQIFWFKFARRSVAISFVMSIFVNIGMWFERFVIIVTSLHRDFPSFKLGLFQANYLGCCRVCGDIRNLLYPLLTVCSSIPCDSHRRGKINFLLFFGRCQKRQVSEDNENAERFEGAPGIPYAKADYTDQVSGKSNVTFNAADLLITKEDEKN